MAGLDTDMLDTLLIELEKVDKMDKKVIEVSSSQKSIQQDITEVKEFVGFDDSAQTKNIIDKDKLPARLTPNERVRYENIGKQFTLGASKEFQKIREKIKFSEKMSTAKDTFIKGFERMKKSMKHVKKSSGLWSKIFKIIGILGLLGYIFRDKIAKHFPETSKFLENTIEKIKEAIGDMFGGLYEYLKKSISESLTVVLKHLANKTIPEIVKSFFGITLPNILLESWLRLMSLFSSSAETQLNDFLKESGTDISTLSEEAVKKANEHFQNKITDDEGIEYLRQISSNLSQKTNDLTSFDEIQLNNFIENTGLLAFKEQQEETQNQFLKIAAIAIHGDEKRTEDIKKMIEDGSINMTDFLNNVEERVKEGSDTNLAIMNQFRKSFGEKLEISEEIKKEQIAAFSKALGAQGDDKLGQTLSDIIKKQNADEENARDVLLTKIEAAKTSQETAAQEVKQKVEEMKPVMLDFSTGFDTMITNSLKTTFDSIESFLNGENANSLVGFIKTGMGNLESFYKKFFVDSTEVLFDAVKGVGDVFSREDGNTNKSPQIQENNYGDNNIIINVDMSDSSQSSVINTISALSKTEGDILTAVQKTNTQLETLVETIEGINNIGEFQKEYIDEQLNDIKGGVDTKTSLKLLASNIGKNAEDIKRIQTELYAPRPMGNNFGYKSLILLDN